MIIDTRIFSTYNKLRHYKSWMKDEYDKYRRSYFDEFIIINY